MILEIDAAAMAADGHPFWITPNQVWLTAAVPPRYLRTPAIEELARAIRLTVQHRRHPRR